MYKRRNAILLFCLIASMSLSAANVIFTKNNQDTLSFPITEKSRISMQDSYLQVFNENVLVAMFFYTDIASLSFSDINMSLPQAEFSQMSVYPNPATTILHVAEDFEESPFSIYSLQGNLILQSDIKDGQINISSLTEGMYLLFMQQAKCVFIKK